MSTFLCFFIFYCILCYLMNLGYMWAKNSKKFDWFIFAMSPIIIPIAIGDKLAHG